MGQGLSCGEPRERTALFKFIKNGALEIVEAMVKNAEPRELEKITNGYGRLSPLHFSAMYGQIEVLTMLLDRCKNPDILSRHKQTPLMLAAIHGKISCVKKLIEAGAYILVFDSLHGRTCLHHAAYHGHLECLQALLSAARSSPLADSWGFMRFVNIRDESGATPLHLAARQGSSECVHMLLDNGALVCASTGGNSYPGSTPLHFAARKGSLDCIRILLAWGADRHQTDAFGRLPHTVALRHKHEACAALLNPSTTEPLVWPMPLRFISDLNPEAKQLLESALMEANKEWEKSLLKETSLSLPSPSHPDVQADDNSSEVSDVELCCICFDQLCTIEIKNCSHLICAHCILALCNHNKPNPITAFPVAPLCPFCRSSITELAVVTTDKNLEVSPSKLRASRKSLNLSVGSSSFKSLSAMSSFGQMSVRDSGILFAAECNGGDDKPSQAANADFLRRLVG